MANGFMDPKNQFLMTAGANLMGQPYSPVPQSAFSGMGNAFSQGMGAYQNALILQEKQREAEEKRQAMAAAQAAKQAQAQQFQQAIAGLPPDRQQALQAFYAADPQGAVKALYDLGMPAEVDNKMGDAAMDSAILSLGLDRKPRGQWTQADVQAVSMEADRIRRLNSPAPAAPPSPYTDVLVGIDKNYINKLDEEATRSISQMEKLNALKSLNTLVTSGSAAAPTLSKIQGVLQEFGLAQIDPNNPQSAQEALASLNFALVQDMRENGARDSQFSTKDMELYQASFPGLSQTPEGRELMTAMLASMAEMPLNRQAEFDDMVESFQEEGMSREMAVQRAVTESRRARRAGAKSGDGLLVRKDGSLTEWGQKVTELSKAAGGQAAPSQPGARTTLPAFPEQQAAHLPRYNSVAEGEASGAPQFIVGNTVYQN